MTLKLIKEQVMFQTNNDVDDLSDFAPHLVDYINEGYDLLLYAELGVHVGDTGYAALSLDADVPLTSAWTHRALADYATWMVYRNGNPLKQQRGYAFNNAFMTVYGKLNSGQGQTITFTNMY